MNTRDRIRAALNFEPFDRLPVIEWAGWWNETIDRWHGEKLPGDLTDRYDICRHFGLDVMLQHWVGVIRPGAPHPAHHGAGLITDAADYDRLRQHLYPDDWCNPAQWRAWAEVQKRGEAAVWFSVDGFFWFPRRLLGIERHLYAFYDQADLLHRINDDLVNWQVRVFDAICEYLVPDFMTFGEDMSYNLGPMLSKEHFDTFLRPYYERIVPRLRERGCVVIVDSDGDITDAVGWFESAGVQGMLPLERQAGVDVAKLRAAHPEMRFIGCYDKMVMNQGEAAMRAEFERLLPVAKRGGLLISCDHQTPPGVSYDDYRLYVRLFREYAQRAAVR